MELEKLVNKAYKFNQSDIIDKFDKKLNKDVKNGFCMMLSMNWLLYAKRYENEKDPALTAMKILWGICSLDNIKEIPTEQAHMALLKQIASQHRAFMDQKKVSESQLSEASKSIVDVLVKQSVKDVERYGVLLALIYGAKKYGLMEQEVDLTGYQDGYKWRGIYDTIMSAIEEKSVNYLMLSIRFKDGTGHGIGIWLDAPGKSARVFDPNFGMASATNCSIAYKGFKKAPKDKKDMKAEVDPKDGKKEKEADQLKQIIKAIAADYANAKFKEASVMQFELK